MSSTRADSTEQAYIDQALAADLSKASSIFDDGAGSGPEQNPLFPEFSRRFLQNPATPVSPPGTAEAIYEAFNAYWTKRLMNPALAARGEDLLLEELKIRSTGQITSGNWFSETSRVLRREGIHSLIVQEQPMVDLIAWRFEHRQSLEIELTDTRRQVDVITIDDVDSHGWQHFASLGLVTTTGWAHEGALYCLEWAYSRGSENYLVSFLKHETRHLVDLEEFPGLTTAHLEYRAKLTELAFSTTTTHRLLGQFASQTDTSSGSAHAQANTRLITELQPLLFKNGLPKVNDPWLLTHVEKVNRLARRLLVKDTEALKRNHRSVVY